MITPAALAAAASGDLANLIAATTPGGIEAQEAAGRRAMASSFKTLPLDMDRIVAAQFGFEYLEDGGDDLFAGVKAPDGWSIRPTDHSMHSDIVDEQGRKRGGIFYKAAFYDRSANGHWSRRYAVGPDYDGEYNRIAMKVTDTATGAVLLRIETVAGDLPRYAVGDAEEKQCIAYLDEHFPDWNSVTAYWNAPVDERPEGQDA